MQNQSKCSTLAWKLLHDKQCFVWLVHVLQHCEKIELPTEYIFVSSTVDFPVLHFCYSTQTLVGKHFPPIRMLVTMALISRPPDDIPVSRQIRERNGGHLVTQRCRCAWCLISTQDSSFPFLLFSLGKFWMFKPWNYLFGQERSSSRAFRLQNERQDISRMDYTFVL